MTGLTGEKTIRYSRSRFFTRLPEDRLYTASHYWLSQRDGGTWCVGFTKFATRMLGELVEFDFEVATNAEVKPGQVIGWVEGFKAVTDVYCCATGSFVGSNPALIQNIELINSDSYKTGWLYEINGTPSVDCLDLAGYVSLLDATIDKMTGKTA